MKVKTFKLTITHISMALEKSTNQQLVDYIKKNLSKGYTLDNCVSCCEFCNFMKSDTPFDNFIEWIRKVNDYTKKNTLLCRK